VVEADQEPLLSGDTCERLGLMKFTIPEELLAIDNFNDMFNDPVKSVSGEVHFMLDSSVSPRVKEQVDKYTRDGHLINVTEPTPWISNMVDIAKP